MASLHGPLLAIALVAVVALGVGSARANGPSGQLAWSTYLGGAWDTDWVQAIAVDDAGNVYVAGYTNSPDFPTTAGALDRTYHGEDDAFVAKLSPDGGNLLFSSFLGGTGMDVARGIGLDAEGNIIVAGETWSTDFPTTSGAFDTTHNGYDDVFVAKLNASGDRLLFSTFIGGSVQEWPSSGLRMDGAGNVYVTGGTDSPDFPTSDGAFNRTFHGSQDVFAAKLSADGGHLLYGTYIGGQAAETADGLLIDAAGRAVITGSTFSSDFPATSGAFDNTSNGDEDAFVAELEPDGTGLVFATFLGGSLRDFASPPVADSNGNVYLSGGTYSPDFPATAGGYDETYNGLGDAFVVALNASGDRLRYATFLGGTKLDTGSSLAVDGEGSVDIVGVTTSADFPVTTGAYDVSLNGSSDVFLAKIGASGAELGYATFLGGSGDFDVASSIAVDPAGAVYAGGWTTSPDFPTTPGVYDREIAGSVGLGDAFVLKFGFSGPAAEALPLPLLVTGAAVAAPGLAALGVLLARQRHLRIARAPAEDPDSPGEKV